MKLAKQGGDIVKITAHEVHENDHFDYEYGLNEHLEHKPLEIRRPRRDDARLRDVDHQGRLPTIGKRSTVSAWRSLARRLRITGRSRLARLTRNTAHGWFTPAKCGARRR